MIHWKKNLYVGSQLEENRKKIISKINRGKKVDSLYLLALPANKKNNLDLIPWDQIVRQPLYPDVEVVGIAADRAEAEEVLLTIAEDVYRETETLNIREWLEQKE